jgi:hypothetical protein
MLFLQTVAISNSLTYLGAVPANYTFSVASSTIYNNVRQHAVLHMNNFFTRAYIFENTLSITYLL